MNAKKRTTEAKAGETKTLCCYAGCKRRVPICAEHAALLTLNDAFVPAATFAGQGVELLMSFTVADLFCGAGGSSEGARS